MKRYIAAIGLCVFLLGAKGADPIDALVARLNADSLWVNGQVPIITLPATAKHREVIAAYFAAVSFDPGRVKRHKILSIRKVVLKNSYASDYFAALVETDLGKKIVLFRRDRTSWWTRSYEIN